MIIGKWKPNEEILAQSNRVVVTKMVLASSIQFKVEWLSKDGDWLYTGACMPNLDYAYTNKNDDGLKEMTEYFMSKDWCVVLGNEITEFGYVRTFEKVQP